MKGLCIVLPAKPNMEGELTDLKLIFQRVSQGDLEALGVLYNEVAPKIYGLALWRTRSSDAASDVVQEVFVKLAIRSKTLSSVRNPLRYVLRMAHHACIDRFRELRNYPKEEILVVPETNPIDDYAICLSILIGELPADQREAIYLRYFVGMSFREIAAATEMNLFTVASRCRLAIRKLRARLGETK
jgi:RNA polymerase sigma-70 factor, ECF subfamily